MSGSMVLQDGLSAMLAVGNSCLVRGGYSPRNLVWGRGATFTALWSFPWLSVASGEMCYTPALSNRV
jgi:hypothetical protein